MVEQASLTKRLSISWRQKLSPAHSRDPHSDVASESAGPGVGEPGGEPEVATPENDGAKPSLPHRLRALVPFMSPKKGKDPDTGSPPPSPPPTAATKSEPGPSTSHPTAAVKTGPALSSVPPAAAINTGSAPPSVPPAAIKTGPLQPGPAALAPAAAPSVSPSSGVACTSAACPVHSKPPAAPQQFSQMTPASPGLHPTFAAFLEQAAVVEAARARQAATAATRTTSPRPAPVQCSPTAALTTSAPVSTSFHTDCSNPNCIAASRRINEVRFVQDTFARINANYSTNYDIAEPIRAALNTAYQVLLECEYRTIMARVDGVTTVLRQVNGRPTLSNQDILMHLLRRTGMQTSNTPRAAPVPAGTGTQQPQSMHAGGGPMPAGAATPAPAPAQPPAAVHTSAVGYAPAVTYMPQTGWNVAGMAVA